ncbi:hypothetical protein HDF26_004491 [Pedobacter cryoconitis]|uniref:Lipoprotein n=1 Tax=Pedobacter cryoconitis TaxID=188932 RepID=A0A7W8ZNS4_9SPHI|nr:hypothetical protein [Pedobacter cryoconitis]MBB5637258.1 hypothetical protein [Pedobacter cryoconitis]MBB6274018.1 hypothetical protein [Pedobacter cryoconitis]
MTKTRYHLLLVAFVFFIISCNRPINVGNKKPEISERESIETKKILDYYIKHELKKDSIILSEIPYIYKSKSDFEDAFKHIGQTNLNLDSLLAKSQKDTTLWSEAIAPASRIITRNDIHKLSYPVMLSNYNKVLGDGFFTLSHLIFSDDFKYAIMYSEYNCGSRCGSGNLLIFKMIDEKWKLIKTYNQVVF